VQVCAALPLDVPQTHTHICTISLKFRFRNEAVLRKNKQKCHGNRFILGCLYFEGLRETLLVFVALYEAVCQASSFNLIFYIYFFQPAESKLLLPFL